MSAEAGASEGTASEATASEGAASVEKMPAETTSDVASDAAADLESQADDVEVVPEVPAAPVVKKPSALRTWVSGHKKTVAAAAIASFVAAAGFAGAAVQPYLMDQAAVATKLKVGRTAADAITALWSYTPEDMDTLPNRSSKFLGGDFEQQYRQYVDAIAPTNKQAKVTSATKVVGVGVESLRGSPQPDEATAIVYTNTTSTTPQSNNIPSIKYLSYRLELKRYGRDWRVTKMTTVTSLDLTPKLGL